MIPGLGRFPGGGHGNPLQYSCLKNPHGWRSMASYRPWGHKESGTTERLSTTCTQYSMDRTVNAMKENSKREKIMKVWKDYIIKDVIVVIEKAMKS